MVARLDGSSNLPGSTIMHKPCNESCGVLCFMTCMKLVSEKGMKHKTASLRRCGVCIYRTGTNGDHASNLPGLPTGRQAPLSNRNCCYGLNRKCLEACFEGIFAFKRYACEACFAVFICRKLANENHDSNLPGLPAGRQALQHR